MARRGSRLSTGSSAWDFDCRTHNGPLHVAWASQHGSWVVRQGISQIKCSKRTNLKSNRALCDLVVSLQPNWNGQSNHKPAQIQRKRTKNPPFNENYRAMFLKLLQPGPLANSKASVSKVQKLLVRVSGRLKSLQTILRVMEQNQNIADQ